MQRVPQALLGLLLLHIIISTILRRNIHTTHQYPSGSMAQKHHQHGPLDTFVNFWRDPGGVAQFEKYFEDTHGVRSGRINESGNDGHHGLPDRSSFTARDVTRRPSAVSSLHRDHSRERIENGTTSDEKLDRKDHHGGSSGGHSITTVDARRRSRSRSRSEGRRSSPAEQRAHTDDQSSRLLTAPYVDTRRSPSILGSFLSAALSSLGNSSSTDADLAYESGVGHFESRARVSAEKREEQGGKIVGHQSTDELEDATDGFTTPSRQAEVLGGHRQHSAEQDLPASGIREATDDREAFNKPKSPKPKKSKKESTRSDPGSSGATPVREISSDDSVTIPEKSTQTSQDMQSQNLQDIAMGVPRPEEGLDHLAPRVVKSKSGKEKNGKTSKHRSSANDDDDIGSRASEPMADLNHLNTDDFEEPKKKSQKSEDKYRDLPRQENMIRDESSRVLTQQSGNLPSANLPERFSVATSSDVVDSAKPEETLAKAPSAGSSQGAVLENALEITPTNPVSSVSIENLYQDELENALSKFEQGRHKEARTELETLSEKIKNAGLPKLYRTIRYHLAEVLVRQGDHAEAHEELKSLQQTKTFQEIEGHLLSSTSFPSLVLDDPEVEIVLDTTRLLGLLDGYYGHYEEANKTLEKAKTGCVKFVEACRNSRLPDTPTDARADQGDQARPMKVVTRQIDSGAMKAKIDLARAKLSMLQGKYGEALDTARPTLRSLERQFGVRHTLTLEAASLNALILSCKFDKEAETICAMTITAMTRHLGRKHPLTMEALGTLVDIFLAQTRYYEALDTVRTLWEQAKEQLGDSHPQTLRYRVQLGEVYHYMGDFLNGKIELQNAYEAARTKWQDPRLGQHPKLLRYLTKLALANSMIGKLDDAERQVEEALLGQASIFSDKSITPSNNVSPIFGQLLPAHNSKFAIPIAAHPDVLESLNAYAAILETIEESSNIGKHDLVLQTFDLVYRKRFHCYGDYHILTLRSGVDLGTASLKAGDESRLGNPQDFFHDILCKCEESLGSDHACTWTAKQWALLADSRDHGPTKLRSELPSIVSGITAQFGPSHPMVLEALAKLLAVELLLKDKAAVDTADRLLRQLREGHTRKQRLMKSLYWEEKVATLYCELGHYEQGLPLFNRLRENLATAGDLREVARAVNVTKELEKFEERVINSSQQFRGEAETLFKQKSAEGDEELKPWENDRVESAMRHAASLSIALYGENARETIKAFITLAEVLHCYDDVQKRLEGLSIIGNLLDGIERVRSRQLENNIRTETPEVPVSKSEEDLQRDNHRGNKNEDELEDLHRNLELRYREWEHDPSENERQEGT